MPRQFSIGRFLDLTSRDEDILRERLAKIAATPGIEHVEILWEQEEFSDAFFAEMQNSLAGIRKIIHAPFINTSLVGHRVVNQAVMALHQNVYDRALALGAEVFTIHAGHQSVFQTNAEVNELLLESLGQLKISPQLKPTLENMPHGKRVIDYSTLSSLVELEAAGNQLPDFGYTVDIGHVIQNSEVWPEWFIRNKNRIYNIHFHDAVKNGKGHLQLGTADLNPAEFIGFLIEQGYDKFLSLEVVGESEINKSWEWLTQLTSGL